MVPRVVGLDAPEEFHLSDDILSKADEKLVAELPKGVPPEPPTKAARQARKKAKREVREIHMSGPRKRRLDYDEDSWALFQTPAVKAAMLEAQKNQASPVAAEIDM